MRIQFTRDLSTADALIQTLAPEHDIQVLSIREKALRERMRDVQIVSVHERPNWLIMLAKMFSRETIPPVYLDGFKRATDEFRPDVLVLMECNRLDLFQALRYKRKNPSCQLVLWTETKRLPKNPVTRMVMQLFLFVVRKYEHLFSHIITYTDEGAAFWKTRLRDTLPITTIPPLVNMAQFYPDSSRLWMPTGKLRIIMNARFVPFKRHEDMVAALTQLKKRGTPFSMTFIGNNSTERFEIETLVKAHDLSGEVTFLDPQPYGQMRGLLAMHDVLVLPSYNEALGLVVPEAMACGLPTITSDTVGANVYVKEGETGFIFPTYDHVALAECLIAISDPQVLSRMGEAAREHFARNFSQSVLHRKFAKTLLPQEH